MKNLFILLNGMLLFACSSTDGNLNYQDVELISYEEQRKIYQHTDRFPPRYPVAHAMSGTNGCATVEYVITPSLKASDIVLIDASRVGFGKEAKKVIEKWHWSPASTTASVVPVKARTRFEFCVKDEEGDCSRQSLQSKTECSEGDLITVVGSKIRIAKQH